MDNQLAYIDQGSFLALRALGRAPRGQLVWVYDHPVDMAALREFHRNLGYGLVGRRIERSPLPFGRHRWIAAPVQADLEVAPAPRPRSEMVDWLDEQLAIPIDPEHGPAWRMAVLPFTDGGAAVMFVASHSVADGGAMVLAIGAAASGVRTDLGYPPAGSRTRWQAVREDARELVRSVPDMARALRAAARVAREDATDLRSSARRAGPDMTRHRAEPVVVPSLAALVDIEQWDRRAAELGGTSNSLAAGFAARLGWLRGRADADGLVTLNFPVTERTMDDTRANALTGISVTVDPVAALTSLAQIRADVKRELTALAGHQHKMLATLALAPITPLRLFRRLEGMALGSGFPVGCSNVGDVPPILARPDGTDADYIWLRGIEWPISADVLDRMGGSLLLGSARINGKVVLGLTGWMVGGANTRDEFAGHVHQALADFGLTGTIV